MMRATLLLTAALCVLGCTDATQSAPPREPNAPPMPQRVLHKLAVVCVEKYTLGYQLKNEDRTYFERGKSVRVLVDAVPPIQPHERVYLKFRRDIVVGLITIHPLEASGGQRQAKDDSNTDHSFITCDYMGKHGDVIGMELDFYAVPKPTPTLEIIITPLKRDHQQFQDFVGFTVNAVKTPDDILDRK